MPITALPTPGPSRSMRPATFEQAMDSHIAALPQFVTEANALAVEVNGIRDATAVIKTETQAIKGDAVAETQAIKTATEAVRDQAAGSAAAAADSAATASTRAAEAAASANFVGPWSSLSGPLNMPASVLHNGGTWRLLANLPDVTASEPGVSADWDQSSSLSIVAYEDRGTLRTAPAAPGAMAIIDGLGLFLWYSGSDEPDDDESCFATASGRWLLEAVHWDVVGAWLAPDWDESQSADEDLQGKFLTATFANAVSSVSANSTTTATVTVSGAEIGDAVIVTRSGQHTSRPEGHVYGVVTSANTVTVYLCADDTVAYFHTGTWRVTVIKP